MVTKEETWEKGINYEFWIDIYTLLYKIDNKDLLHIIENSIQNSVRNYMRKESEKNGYMYN